MTRAADLAKLIAGGGSITVSDNSENLKLVTTDADANVGPVLNLHRNSASPADNDLLGRIVFKADDDAGNESTFARIEATATDVTNAISTLKKLKPKTYNFISDPDNISEDGFLAHELGAVVPNAVTGEKDAMTSDNEIKPQQVDYGRLTPLLTAALQEAIARIDTLEAEVKKLKGE